MARKTRVFVNNAAQYVLLTTEYEGGMFAEKEDYEYFMKLLRESVAQNKVAIHAFTLLPKSFAFLTTPYTEEALPKFMQVLARRYIVYFNKKYAHEGTLWKQRYTSILVDVSEYLYDVIKYIETRGDALVSAKEIYPYSSACVNAAGKNDGITVPRQEFSLVTYHNYYGSHLSKQTFDFITNCIDKQRVIGGERFIRNIEEKIGILLRIQGRGRPKKENKQERENMYKNLVVLDKEEHKGLKLLPMDNLLFAKELSAIPLVLSEVKLMAKHYPIVFTNNESRTLKALVSLGQTNLAVSTDGKWFGDYVPAELRKYPFMMVQSRTEVKKEIIMIDESASILSKSKGKQLYKKSGDASEILEKSVFFATEVERQMRTTDMLVKEIKKAGILEPKEISVKTESNIRPLVRGFSIVDEKKLAQLDRQLLKRWEEQGVMAIINIHLDSLKNIQTLFTLAKNRQA